MSILHCPRGPLKNEFHSFLAAYGQRGDKWYVTHPAWVEDPSPVIKNLKDYTTQPDRDFEAEMEELSAARDRAVAEARQDLSSHPQQMVARFEFLLKAAQEGAMISTSHGFWLDFSILYRLRRVLLEVGRRLAEAGIIRIQDDIFYLTLNEVRATGKDLQAGNHEEAVSQRRTEMELFKATAPPPVLGTNYGPPPDNFITRMIGGVFAGVFGPPLEVDEDPNLIHGVAGSSGTAKGPARVVRSVSEADKLEKGDILVAETTAAPWTPFFGTASAVVTDAGGILSHCAVVAREYQIPAVVGTDVATARITDGQIIEVDGDQGVVRLRPD